MDWRETIRRTFVARDRIADDDVVEELAQHADAAYATARADGQSEAEARAHILGLIDGWSRDTAAGPRRTRRAPLVEPPPSASNRWAGLGLDLRYAWRMVRRRPTSALVSTMTMALGIGAATTLFSVAYNVLEKPLPYAEAARLIRVSETHEGSTRVLPPFLTNATYLAWKDHPSTVDALAAWADDVVTVRVGGATAERVKTVSATASLFGLLEAHAVVGRLFGGAEEAPGSQPVAVLSYGAWQRWFGGQPDVASLSIDVGGVRRAVIGVMPASFEFPDRETVLWMPLSVPPVVSPGPERTHTLSMFDGLARLRPGATAAEAAAEATARARTAPALGMVGIAVFGTQGPAVISAIPLLDALTRDVQPALMVLLAAVGLLLATAVLNISNMQLAHASGRRREMAIRAALGAGTRRLARQLFVEHALVAAGGGASGLVLALAAHNVLPRLLPGDFPRAEDIAMGWPVAVFALAATFAASVVFGLTPTWLARRLNLVEALTEDSLAPVGGGLRTRVARTRAVLMTAQVAVAAVLLVGAALLSRSWTGLMHADRGYQPAGVLTARVSLPDQEFAGPKRATLLGSLLDRLRRAPGVTDAAVTDNLPLVRFQSLMSFTMPSRDGRRAQVPVQAGVADVSPRYFEALGIRVIEGRSFTDADTVTSEPVVVVNRSFANTYLDGHALGASLPAGFSRRADRWRVVGVVEDVHQQSASEATHPHVFVSYQQRIEGLESDLPALVIKTEHDPAAFVPTLRALVRDENSTVALESVMTMEQRLTGSLAKPRLYAVVLVGFAGFALLLAGVGLFGVLSFAVAQRAREIGVRAALGARPADLVRLVVGQALVVTAAGTAIGLTAAYVLARYGASLLFGVTAHDPLTFALVPAGLLTVAAGVCVWPARRAASVDPVRAMRS